LNKLLGALSEHGRLIHGSNQVDILASETFSKMDKGSVEATCSVSNTIVDVRVQVGSTGEHMSWEVSDVIGALDEVISGTVAIDSVCHG